MLPALVLTAGFGARLDPITRLVAKPAVPLAGRAIIEHVLSGLVQQGVTDAVLNLHHLPETVTSVVGDGAHLGLRVRYSWESPILGSAGGPRHALPLLDSDTFLIVNGDTLCDVALAPLIAAHRFSGAAATLAVVPNPAPDHYNGFQIDTDDRIIGVVPRGTGGESWHFVGVQVACASVFSGLADGVPAESVHGIYRALMAHPQTAGSLLAHRVKSAFHDVGTPGDYLAAARAFGGDSLAEPGARIDPTARVTGTIVWPNALVGARAVLNECIVTNVDVPPDFRAERAILVPASVRRDGDHAQQDGDIAWFPIAG